MAHNIPFIIIPPFTMRRNNPSLQLLCGLVLALLASACQKTVPALVEYPIITAANTETVDILSVETIEDSVTILKMQAHYHPHYWIRVADDSYLQANGKKYAIVGADSIKLGERFWMPESGVTEFSLRFEPLENTVRSFDFIEGDDPGAYKLFGVDLTGDKPSVYPDGLPKELKKEPVDGPLPDPIFEMGRTTLNIHLLNYRPEMDVQLRLYVNTMFLGQQEISVPAVDENGFTSVSFDQYGTVEALLADAEDRSVAHCWLAPGETAELYADMRHTGVAAMRYRDADKRPEYTPSYLKGVYGDMSRFVEQGPREYYGLDLYTGEFADFHLTNDEYFDMVMSRYNHNADSIAASDAPQMLKEYRLTGLQSEVMKAVALNRYFREHNYMHVYDKTPRGGIPADSIVGNATPEHFKRLCATFNPVDPKILLLAHTYRIDWGLYGAKGDLAKSILMTSMMAEKAENLKLTRTDINSLRALSNPFFAEACDALYQRSARIVESMKDDSPLQPTPKVADDKVFDAIIAPHKGKVVVVDLWNTWCGPCRASIKNHHEPLKESELADPDIIWVYIANETSPMPKYYELIPGIKGLHYRLNYNQWDKICNRFGVDGIPFYILVDRSGKAVARPDIRNVDLYKRAIMELLKEK